MSRVYESIVAGLAEAIEDAKEKKHVSEMSLLERYLNNPCATLSIPYWKHKSITIPSNMRIVHDNEFRQKEFAKYKDEPYFRLIHHLKEVHEVVL